jgi:hypothetical protein
LESIHKFKITRSRHVKWFKVLSEVKYTIKYITGKENELADYLSRPNMKDANSESTILSYEGKVLLNNIENKPLDPGNEKRKKRKRKKVSKSKKQKIFEQYKKIPKESQQIHLGINNTVREIREKLQTGQSSIISWRKSG